MTKKFNKTIFMSLVLAVVLVTAMALSLASCDKNKDETESNAAGTDIVGVTVGEGSTEFLFDVMLPDGTTKNYIVKTDKENVGEALTDVGLISGEQGPYGLYVKTVDGVTLDFDKDKMYWSFCIDGEYAMSGVDATAIEAGTRYSFVAQK